MPRYLSADWIDALDAAFGASAGVTSLAPLVIEQVIEGVPGAGVVRYALIVDEHGGRVRAGPQDAPADLRIITDYETAVAIARGEQNAQIALSHGRLRLGGDIDTLARCAAALDALGDVAAQVRATTTYEDRSSEP